MELAAAIYSAAASDTTLDNLITQTGDLTHGIYFIQAPEEAVMPYIVFYIIDQRPEHCFRAADSFEDVLVQFSIYDKSSSEETVSSIRDALVAVFDRAVLVYDTKTAIGCLREGETGPSKENEECWIRTVDYRINYK